mgnify:CR=1 FL=1
MQYVISSDFHDDYKTLEHLLTTYNGPNVQLILLGDYFDSRGGGGDPKGMARVLTNLYNRVYEFANEPIILLGNHDDFILGTVEQSSLDYQTWMLNGGKRTLDKLGFHHRITMEKAREFLLEEYPEVISLLSNARLYYENSDLIAVHAGLDWSLDDPRDTFTDDMLWLREEYIGDLPDNPMPNKLGKPIVTGHTPVQNYQDSNQVMILKANEDDVPRYLIDGGSNSGYSNGKVNVLMLSF